MSLIEGLARELNEVDGLTYSLTGGNVFELDWPNDPDLAVVVRGSGGPEAVVDHVSNEQHAQLMFRAEPEAAHTAEALWWAVFWHLSGINHKQLPDGTWVDWIIVRDGGPITIGADENGRQRFSMNVRAEVRR